MNERDAGDFGSWLQEFTIALRHDGSVDVPCNGCTACCTSGQLIPVEADDADARAHLPPDALVAMPGQPELQVLRHEDGRCSQLTEAGCSVYEHRPRACRTYDCRIFAAAGVTSDKPLIAEQALRWRFRYATRAEQQRHSDVRTAALVLGFPGSASAPASPTEHALAAIAGAEELSG